MVLIPLKWAAELVGRDMHPWYFASFLLEKVKECSDKEAETYSYTMDWVVTEYTVFNKTSDKETSQVGLHLLDLDNQFEPFEGWTGAKLS